METLMRQNKEMKILQDFFQVWKNKYFYTKNSTYVYAYTIIFIKNALQVWIDRKNLKFCILFLQLIS